VNETRLRFSSDGLIPAIIRDHRAKEVLMMAYMNDESLRRTLKLGRACFWSRSRQQLWLKGESSGHYQIIRHIAADCDYDTLLVDVDQIGPGACHEGYYSCFHNELPEPYASLSELQCREKAERSFNPEDVYEAVDLDRAIDRLYESVLSGDAEIPDRDWDELVSQLVAASAAEDRKQVLRVSVQLIRTVLGLAAATGIALDEIRRELVRGEN